MTIVIHVGTHKTGTTTLQRFASSHREQLRERGLWYPTYDEIGLFGHYAHHHLAFAMSDNDHKKLSEKDARRFIEHIAKKRRSNEKVLLSAEPLYRLTLGGGRSVHRFRSSSAAYWEARDRFVAGMREFFPLDDVEILICLRRQDRFARSVFQERVKVTKFNDSFSTFLHKDRSIFDYLGQIDVYARYFPKVKVAIFENLVATGDLHSAFFDLLGIDISFSEKRPVVNPSLPLEFVEFKRLLNRTEIDPELAKKFGEKLLALAQSDAVPLDRSLDWLSLQEIAGFQGSFERDNEVLRSRYAPALDAPLFPPVEREERKPFSGLSAQSAIEIARQFIDTA